jgi:imidazolonepropionase-like amidohydrolase
VQFSDEELRAIVEEAAAARSYCAAHADPHREVAAVVKAAALVSDRR